MRPNGSRRRTTLGGAQGEQRKVGNTEMKKVCAAGIVGLFMTTLAGSAMADPVTQGLAIGVERTFGLVIASDTQEGDFGTSTESNTSISLGFSPLDGLATTYSAPRVGLDYIMSSGLSIGGGLGYTTVSNSSEFDPDTGPTVESDNGSVSAFLFSPRVGFLAEIGDGLGIWPRGGLTYVSLSTSEGDDGGADSSQSRMAFTVEAPLVVMAGALGFLIAPTLDIGLSGSAEDANGDEVDADFSATEFGIQLGLFGVI